MTDIAKPGQRSRAVGCAALLALVLAVMIHAHAPLAQAAGNYPFIMTFTGPEETVMTWGQWGIVNFPDGHLSYVRDGANVRMWAVGGGATYFLTGPDFDHLAPPVLDSSGKAIPVLSPSGAGFDQGYAGAYSVVRAANGTDLLMAYHAEHYPEAQPSAANPTPCAQWGIGLARSSDGGATWTRLGQIISTEQPFVPCNQGGLNSQGAGSPTVTLSPDGQFFYLYHVQVLQTPEPDQPDNGNGIRLARAPIASDGVPGAWQKYFNGNFNQPGLGGRGSPVIRAPGWLGSPVVSFNIYLNRYIAVSMLTTVTASTSGFVYLSSIDGISWEAPRMLWVVPPTNVVPSLHPGDSWYHYPTFVSLDRPNQLTTGQTGYLYYAHGVVQPGNLYFRNMARRPVMLLPDPGIDSAVTVDFGASQPAAKSMSGFLYGISETQPADDVIMPLRPRNWRFSSFHTKDGQTINPAIYGRIRASGATVEQTLSEFWQSYPGSTTQLRPRPWQDYAMWEAFVRQSARASKAAGQDARWQVWWTPDNAFFWDGTREQFFETYRRAYQILRQELGVGVAIGGGFAAYNLASITQFLDFCKVSGCEVNFLVWHETNDAAVTTIPDRVTQVRQTFVSNPAYAALHLTEIHPVYVTATAQFVPGRLLGYLNYLEASGVDGATRSCPADSQGQGSCFNNSMDGLLVPATGQPRAAWWLYKAYADGADARVASTGRNPKIVALGSSRSASASAAQVLIGALDSPPVNVLVELAHLEALPFVQGSQVVRIRIDKIPSTGEAALQSLIVVGEQDYPVVGGSASLVLEGVESGDGYVLTITAPPALALSASVNQSTFAVGQTVRTSARVVNPGLAGSADLYLGVLLPDGRTIVFWTGGSGTAIGSLADLRTFRPYDPGVSLATPFTRDMPNFLSYPWAGAEPHGGYVLFNLATKTGALDDGVATNDDVIGLATAPFSFP